MIATQEMIDDLAKRIDLAYRLRCPDWNEGCSTHRIWDAAATALLRAHEVDPLLPIDPELYVAAQTLDSPGCDPWESLVHASSVVRYRKAVRRIVSALRRELRREIRRAERRVDRGESWDEVLSAQPCFVSPLSGYLCAHRAGRPDLASGLFDRALEQHEACPLYQQASASLLSASLYPVAPPVKQLSLAPLHLAAIPSSLWN